MHIHDKNCKLYERAYKEMSILQHSYDLSQAQVGRFLSVRCHSLYPVCKCLLFEAQ